MPRNYAHKQGLVHRDVKPGNILIDSSEKPYVADFWIFIPTNTIAPRFPGMGYLRGKSDTNRGPEE